MTADTERCRKCGEPIEGGGFGSPEAGYEHPFSCPQNAETSEAKVWVLVIEHRHGFNHYAHRTERGAYQTLYDYACEWWQELGPETAGEPTPPPTDFAPDDAVAFYFEHIYEEWYTLDEVKVGE